MTIEQDVFCLLLGDLFVVPPSLLGEDISAQPNDYLHIYRIIAVLEHFPTATGTQG